MKVGMSALTAGSTLLSICSNVVVGVDVRVCDDTASAQPSIATV